jgi:hypothetical protein
LVEESIKSGAVIGFFLDSNIKKLVQQMRNPLVGPVIEAVYDMTRGFYDIALRDAAVTNLLQDPCSLYSFELSQFEQPLSAEVCARICLARFDK